MRNQLTWRDRLARLRSDALRFDLSRYEAPLERISRSARDVALVSDAQITASANALRVASGQSNDCRNSLLALACEASFRTLGQRPFDEQIVAALSLDDGSIVELQTGEGKTLAGVLTAALHGLAGHGVHVLTFNDYLAQRDAQWMEPVFSMLGLSVDFVQQGMPPEQRRRAYAADVTYVTAREAGFDYLRDGLATRPESVVQRPRHSALVDEADSLMLDEAQVPLIVAGGIETDDAPWSRISTVVAALSPGVHFHADGHERVELTDAGVDQVEGSLATGSLHAPENYDLLTWLNCALQARVLLRRDVDYLVRDRRIEMVDSATGRVAQGRRWPAGLQSALEAKEHLPQSRRGRILASASLRFFFRGYPRLCGMTGTARAAAEELRDTYGTPVVVLPSRKRLARVDHPEIVFPTLGAKDDMVVRHVQAAQRLGRPVLVGTSSIVESERLAARLASMEIHSEVLNARDDTREALIVARAGTVGAVTISTNMAGRGTDIRLGGTDGADSAVVAALGGLCVISTSRNNSSRLDMQLRGRAGRQGDPGESRFFTSAEDDIVRRYGGTSLFSASFQRGKPDATLPQRLAQAEMARVQRVAEGLGVELRRALAGLDAVVDEQYLLHRERRRDILAGPEEGRETRLRSLDCCWSERLSECADLREGVHLVRLGGRDPLAEYSKAVTEVFAYPHDRESLWTVEPRSTWTYVADNDPFRDQVALGLISPGQATQAIYAGAVLAPLFLLWAIVERWGRPRAVPLSRQ